MPIRLDDLCSPWPWSAETTMSSDFRHIRRINDSDGEVVADVRYVETDLDDQRTAYANVSLFILAPEMAQALRLIEEVLSDHPDVNVGNSKVHFAALAAKAMVSRMEKGK